MKRFFTSLKAMVGTVIMVSMLGSVSLATSCSDEYDDTAIKDQIDQIQDELASLTQRVANLEKQLSDEVAALTALINGKTVVVSAVQEGDNWKITLSDGTEFTVYGECDHEGNLTDTDTFISVQKDTDNVYYWAVFNKEGFVEFLLVDGQKVPVYSVCDCEDTPAQTPAEGCDCKPVDFKIEVNEEGYIKFSIDGGTTWTTTTVKADTACECKGCVFSGVKVNEDGTVTFTMADGSAFNVAISELIDFGVRSSVYVKAEASREIALTVNEAVESIDVMNQPMGWKASIDGTTLTVTAPSKSLMAAGVAEKSGVISLHVNTAAGACKVAKLNVNLAELALEVDKEGNITVTNSLTATWEEEDMDWNIVEVTDFVPYFVGVIVKDEYYTGDILADISGYDATVLGTYSSRLPYFDIPYTPAKYEDGVTDYDVLKLNIKDIVNNPNMNYYGVEFEGTSFVVVVYPTDPTDYGKDLFEEYVAFEFNQVAVKMTEVEGSAKYNDIAFDVNFKGGIEYHIMVNDAESVDSGLEYGQTVADYYYQNLQYWSQYGMDFGQQVLREDFAQDGIMLSELMTLNENHWKNNLKANTEYEIAVLPVEDGREKSTYTYDDLVTLRFTTGDVVAATTPMEVEFSYIADFTSITATVNFSEDVATLYYGWSDTKIEDADIPAKAAELMGGYYSVSDFSKGYTFSHKKGYLAQGSTWYFLTVLVNANGEYTFVQNEAKTMVVSVNTDYTLSLGEYSLQNGEFVVNVNGLEGAAISQYRYYMVSVGLSWKIKDNETIAAEIATSSDGDYRSITGVDVTNPLHITKAISSYSYADLKAGVTYKFALVAIFEDGSVSNAVIVDEVTYELSVIRSSDERWAATKPTFKLNYYKADAYGGYDIIYDFENVQEGVTVYSCRIDDETIANYPGRSQKVSYIMDNPASYYDDFSWVDSSLAGYIGYYQYNNQTSANIYYCWTDAEGNFYESTMETVSAQ